MHKRSSAILRATLLAVIVGIATPGLAAPPEGKGGGKDKGGDVVCEVGLFSPVILLKGDGTWASGDPVPDFGPFQMKEDGSCLEAISVFGDLTHNGWPGERYFLVTEQQPDESYDLVIYSEDGERLNALTADPPRSILDIYPLPRWSMTETQLAYAGTRYNPALDVIEKGIFVGKVKDNDGNGVPDTIENEMMVVEEGANEYLIPFLSWSWDDTRIAYYVRESFANEIYVVDVSMAPPEIYEIHIEGGGYVSTPSFSPRPYDDRLLLRQKTRFTVSCLDIYVVHVSLNYDGITPLPAARITKSKLQDCPMGHPQWSPDGEYISFTGSKSPRQIHKIKSDGSEKAVKLTNSEAQGYWVTGWRE